MIFGKLSFVLEKEVSTSWNLNLKQTKNCAFVRFVAPTALLATVSACLMIMLRESLDAHNDGSCYFNQTDDNPIVKDFKPEFPSIDFLGFGEGDPNTAPM